MPRNYVVSRHGTEHQFTIAQVQALRGVFGAAAKLVRDAVDPRDDAPIGREPLRVIKEEDFVRLVEALDKVRQTMREEKVL